MSTSNPVVIVDYDPAWPVQAAKAIVELRNALGQQLLAIEHIGSTSVPGLAAKPILDLMAGVSSLEAGMATIPAVESLGYCYRPDDTIPERVYFNRGPENGRTHHLHMVVFGGEFWVRHLAFRNALRADPALAAEYAALKRGLAAEYGTDRLGYTDAKTAFIRSVEAQALNTR